VPRLRAFSLLEVMVAIALLAVGMTVLLQVQTRSINLAQQAREMTVATMLARSKLLDCQADLAKKGFSIGDYDEEGNFGDDGYPDFFWECHAYKPDIPVADTADVQQAFSATGNEETGQAAEQQGADLGMQFLAPVMSQLSSVLGDSIRLVTDHRCPCGRTAPIIEHYGRDLNRFTFAGRTFFVRDVEERLLVAPVEAVGNLWLLEVRPAEVRFRVEAQQPDGSMRDPNQLELFSALVTGVPGMQRKHGRSDAHQVTTLSGNVLRGTWDEILLQLKVAESGAAMVSLSEFMAGLARRGREETGVIIPLTDAEAFIRGSAEAGVLRIVQ